MKFFWLTLKAIFVKDIITEFRAKQFLPIMIVLGMLMTWIFRIAAEAMPSGISVFGTPALWIVFLFSGLLVQERSFAVEQQNDCINGLLLAPVDPGTIFLAKLLVNITLLTIFEIIIVPVVLLAFQLNVPDKWPTLIAVLFLGNVGICSLGTLFSATVQLANTRSALLSIIVLVILMPMMIPAIVALLALFNAIPSTIVGTGSLAFVGSLDAAIGYMIAFDAIFIVACWLLFPFAVKE